MTESLIKNECIYCGEKLKGRKDKKFCSTECRNTYNNNRYAHKLMEVSKINKILKKNRSILQKFNIEDKCWVSKERLLFEGFDFNYFTSIFINKRLQEYRFCYEEGYRLDFEKEKVLLVHKLSNLDKEL